MSPLTSVTNLDVTGVLARLGPLLDADISRSDILRLHRDAVAEERARHGAILAARDRGSPVSIKHAYGEGGTPCRFVIR